MREKTIAIVGLGYVGLPLAVEFGKKFPTIGYDLSERKVDSYRNGCDPSGDVSTEDFIAAKHTLFTRDSSQLSKADFIIVAVPTPVDSGHQIGRASCRERV